MPRDAYYAPGVYVEEIPSARQPIAGVGTNTVGFIGVVPDVIWYPVRNPNYDPVMAQAMLAYRRARAAVIASGSDAARARAESEAEADAAPLRGRQAALNMRLADLRADAERLAAEAATAKSNVDAASRRAEGLQGPAREEATSQLLAAESDATERTRVAEAKQREVADAEKDLADIGVLLDSQPSGAAPAPPPAGGTPARPAVAGEPPASPFEETDPAYTHDDTDPPEELRHPSMFRPYYLQPFTVTAQEFDTKLCTNFSEYTARFGEFSAFKDNNPLEHDRSKKTFQPYYRGHHLLTHAVSGFFANGGTKCFVARVHPGNIANWKTVLDEFESIEDVAILAAPGIPKS